MLTVIGGTYHEICREPQPQWDELFGSGWRAALALCEKKTPVNFYTYADEEVARILLAISAQFSINIFIQPTRQSIEFFYEHPLKSPSFFPSLESYRDQEVIKLNSLKDVICFGMLEGNAILKADRIVYDPQRPANPLSFGGNGSTANELIIVMNLWEARQMTNKDDLESISGELFQLKELKAAIIKCGPDGAYLLQSGKSREVIPSFITEKVWPIGTGDIFTSYFGYQWMVNDLPIFDAAIAASKAAAFYANSITLPIPDNLIDTFPPFIKSHSLSKTVYLAGPFFTMSQRWLINEFRDSLHNMDVRVFSPLHDVGLGQASEVVEPDLMGIRECDMVLAIADGLDSGTLFEVGYARALGKPVVVFAENSTPGSLTMLEGTACEIENDFSTCIYKVVWQLSSLK